MTWRMEPTKLMSLLPSASMPMNKSYVSLLSTALNGSKSAVSETIGPSAVESNDCWKLRSYKLRVDSPS